MNYLEIWFNLRDTTKDLQFCRDVAAYLNHLKDRSLIESWRLTRRKFGFGPEELGEFHINISTTTLDQLDSAFALVATRDGDIERLHFPVYTQATNVKSALYRDFPDPERKSQ